MARQSSKTVKARRQRIMTAYQKGDAVTAIAKKEGLSRSAVYKNLVAMGIDSETLAPKALKIMRDLLYTNHTAASLAEFHETTPSVIVRMLSQARAAGIRFPCREDRHDQEHRTEINCRPHDSGVG